MSNHSITCEDIQDEHLDTLIRLAYRRQAALEAEKIIAESESAAVDDEEAKNAFSLFEQKLAAQKQAERRQSHTRRKRHIFSRLINVAACLIVILAISAPIAVANIDAVRVKVIQMLVSVEQGHVDISLVENEDAAFYVPAQWEGVYYPSYIPDGYELTQIIMGNRMACYENSEGLRWDYSELSGASISSLDSEGGTISYELVNGYFALVIVTPSSTSVSWSDGELQLCVDTDFGKEEALKIARSVCKILKNS